MRVDGGPRWPARRCGQRSRPKRGCGVSMRVRHVPLQHRADLVRRVVDRVALGHASECDPLEEPSSASARAAKPWAPRASAAARTVSAIPRREGGRPPTWAVQARASPSSSPAPRPRAWGMRSSSPIAARAWAASPAWAAAWAMPGERVGAHPDRVAAAQQHRALAEPAQRRVGVAAGEPDVAEQEGADGPALGVGRGGVRALGLVGGLVQAAGEPVGERLRRGQVALAGGLPAPRDGDGLVAAAADGERLGHGDRGAGAGQLGRALVGLDRRRQRQGRARIALREGEAGAQGVRGRAADAVRACAACRPAALPPRVVDASARSARQRVRLARAAGRARRRRGRPRPRRGGRASRSRFQARSSASVARRARIGAVSRARTRSACSGRPVAISARAAASSGREPAPDWSAARAKPSPASLDMSESDARAVRVFRGPRVTSSA